MSNIKVRVTGVGSSREVEVSADEANIAAVLKIAGIDAESAGLNTSVNGESADGDTPVSDGDQVLTTPREAKLG